ncbi:MAG: hypothetical protein EOM59_20025 [Clostridia bacterium]|nr:hypothetical protein [Clostridia bacterium]
MNRKYSLLKTTGCIFLLACLSVGYAGVCYVTVSHACVNAGGPCKIPLANGGSQSGTISAVEGNVKQCLQNGSPGMTGCDPSAMVVPCKYECIGASKPFVVDGSRASAALYDENCD